MVFKNILWLLGIYAKKENKMSQLPEENNNGLVFSFILSKKASEEHNFTDYVIVF